MNRKLIAIATSLLILQGCSTVLSQLQLIPPESLLEPLPEVRLLEYDETTGVTEEKVLDYLFYRIKIYKDLEIKHNLLLDWHKQTLFN